jgi:hypothetical protein
LCRQELIDRIQKDVDWLSWFLQRLRAAKEMSNWATLASPQLRDFKRYPLPPKRPPWTLFLFTF